jgi:methylenetetrahydrofolate--tRNA-(uracil-5-)-methyltransferase
MTKTTVTIVGGGLAGTEAAWQIAEQNIPVILYEMRPGKQTPAHTTNKLAELVCSNSLGSNLPNRAPGLLKEELRYLNSMLIEAAEQASVPAGGALAVDRNHFADIVTDRIQNHRYITLKRKEFTTIPDGPAIIASGPLTSDALAKSIATLGGTKHLYFYDAISPIVTADSIDMRIAFRASRYQRGQQDAGDYINCPFNKEEYTQFVQALLTAEKIELKTFEEEDMRQNFFEMCLPIEEMARRGQEALAFGPMRPVGLFDPRIGRRPYAALQLRQDNIAASLYNLVGFQTNLRWGEQKRIFQTIPGLANAEFMRYGTMHRNTYINAPTLLKATMQWHNRPDLFFAGQIVGVEGYAGNIGSGLLAGINMVRFLQEKTPVTLPPTTMLGALAHYITHAEAKGFQPMKANFGILPPLKIHVRNKRARYQAYSERAMTDLKQANLKLKPPYQPTLYLVKK